MNSVCKIAIERDWDEKQVFTEYNFKRGRGKVDKVVITGYFFFQQFRKAKNRFYQKQRFNMKTDRIWKYNFIRDAPTKNTGNSIYLFRR